MLLQCVKFLNRGKEYQSLQKITFKDFSRTCTVIQVFSRKNTIWKHFKVQGCQTKFQNLFTEPNKNSRFFNDPPPPPSPQPPSKKKIIIIIKFDNFSKQQELCDGRTSTCLQPNVPFWAIIPLYYHVHFTSSSVIYGCCRIALIYR